jgi:hypothetical protein
VSNDGTVVMPEVKPSERRGGIGRAFAAAVRILGWSLLGAVCGVLLGCCVGVIHAPAKPPSDPLEYEWYMPFVLILVIPLEWLAGLLIGAGIAVGVPTPARRRRTFLLALGGAILGVGFGWVLGRVFHVILIFWHDGSQHMTSLALQAVGAIVGIIFATSRHAAEVGPSSSGKKGRVADASGG